MPKAVQLEDFNKLDDYEKKQMLVDADKVAEENLEDAKYELFLVGDFYVEVKTSFILRYRVISNAYRLNDIPLIYAGKVAARFQ